MQRDIRHSGYLATVMWWSLWFCDTTVISVIYRAIWRANTWQTLTKIIRIILKLHVHNNLVFYVIATLYILVQDGWKWGRVGMLWHQSKEKNDNVIFIGLPHIHQTTKHGKGSSGYETPPVRFIERHKLIGCRNIAIYENMFYMYWTVSCKA